MKIDSTRGRQCSVSKRPMMIMLKKTVCCREKLLFPGKKYFDDVAIRLYGKHIVAVMPPIKSTNGVGGSDVLELIGDNEIVIAGNPAESRFSEIAQIFNKLDCKPTIIDTTKDEIGEKELLHVSGHEEFPLAWVKGSCAGSLKDIKRLALNGSLQEWLKPHDYDLVVIGGGSGGLAASKEAVKFGKKVLVLDFVTPTPTGTTWGLGGTCVNVGCIPKKLMHQAALLGKSLTDAQKFGWKVPDNVDHEWVKMKDGIQGHIGTLNWGYRVALREASVDYKNCYGSFNGSHSIKAVTKRGKEETITSDRFILAPGLRPKYPDIPGAKEYCITSDDLFSLPQSPGNTLFVGASYVSLECAGFVHGIGLPATVMVRSILLRGFDQDMAERVGKHMEDHGIKFIRGAVPTSVEKVESGKLKVTAQSTDGEIFSAEYDTVVMAIGREARTDSLNLTLPQVQTDPKSKKLVVRNEQSVSAPWVYGIGDVIEGGLELTPVAIQAGRLLANRLFNKKSVLCDYVNVPTTVFTPMEYGCCGLSEDDAIEEYGSDGLFIYHNLYQPLEYTVAERDPNQPYAKMIVRKEDDRVLGIHIVGPNAGEIMQGFGIALKMNATKSDFDNLIGIHPTCAEVFTTMNIVKEEGAELQASGC